MKSDDEIMQIIMRARVHSPSRDVLDLCEWVAQKIRDNKSVLPEMDDDYLDEDEIEPEHELDKE